MSTMMPDETLETPDESKPKLPLSRILLLLLLMIAILALFLDRRARTSAEEAASKLEQLIDSGDQDKTPDVVQKLVGKEPNKDPEYELSSTQVEVYSWRGRV